jgi:hypothetical protein
MRGLLGAVVVGAVALAAAPGGAQSLGELAAKEREKRNKSRAAGKVYSDEDLRKQGGAAAPADASSEGAGAEAASAGASSEAGAGSEAGATTEVDERAEREKAWRARWDKANTTLEQARADLATAQSAYDSAPDLMKPAFQGRLDDAQKKMRDAQQAVDALDDERRFSGFRR